MFYYPAVLKRHSGCFSTIWLVATKGIKVPRRDFLKVNVKSTCDDIMSYVLERVPPPRPGLPQPRFSLYLSSQLQYGVVVVFHRQCAILLEELQSIVSQLLKQRSSHKIDMEDSSQALVLPDALSLMEGTEGALDPLFGEMHQQDVMPSPSTLMQMSREYLRKASPELPELTRPAASTAPELEGITASPDSITLRERELVTIPAAEYEGEELIDHPADTIDFLLSQTDQFPEAGGVELPREETTPREEERELERERRDVPKERTKKPTRSTTELQSTAVSGEDAVLLAEQEPGLHVEEPRPPTEQVTPVSGPALPSSPSAVRERHPGSLELEDVRPEVKRRRKRRQLVFFDPETQLSENELKQMIDDPLTETRRSVFPLLSPQRTVPAPELFNTPCSFLPSEIQSLWRQAASITPLPGSDLQVGERGLESTDSEREREREMMEVAEKEDQVLEQIPKEVPREMVESEMLDISADDILPLEASDQRELSREISPVYTSDREGSTVSKSAPALQDIPEAERETTERAAPEPPGLELELPELEEEPVRFHSLLPAEVNRRSVSKIFQRLLENLSSRRFRAEQDEAYGDILIFPGSNYEGPDLA